MGGVRARKSRRTKTVNSTKAAQNRKKKHLQKPNISDKIVRHHWDEKKTLKQNFKSIGLAFDPNDACKGPRKKEALKDINMDESMEAEDSVVVKKLTEESSQTSKKERFISKGEAQFIMMLWNDYGENYQAMARDKRNFQQHTPNQLRRKFEAYFRSSYFEKYEKAKGE